MKPPHRARLIAALPALVLAAVLALAPAAGAAPSTPQQLLAKGDERPAEYSALGYTSTLVTTSVVNAVSALATQATDPDRFFLAGLCATGVSACAGDVRLDGFEERGRGLSRPVRFTARNGSTISAHVWATSSGPARRPLVVITSGSIQAPEQPYWWAAQTLAKAGYVVVTSDPAGQGQSDLLGAGADALEGVHPQVAGNTFYDGTQDALDFALSSPSAPYCPRPSRGGTRHCDKQQARVDGGRASAFNPLWRLVDPDRVGLAGHSYGASGVSWVGQQDPRVDAVVAWDRLCDPSSVPASCSRGGQGGPVALRVPALSISADSFLGVEVLQGPPSDPAAKAAPSRRYSAAGIDTGSIGIRGGTHFEFSYIPLQAFRATRRGIDLAAWYTLAWLDKYVKGDPTADRRLLSDRWRRDRIDASLDPSGGGNLLSDWSTSRLDVRRADGSRFRCEDLRAGCDGQVTDDGQRADWGFLPIATAKDGTPAIVGGQDGPAAAAPPVPAAAPRLRVRLRIGGRPTDRARRVRVIVRNAGSAVAGRVVLRAAAGARGRLSRTRVVLGRVAPGRSRSATLVLRRRTGTRGPVTVTAQASGDGAQRTARRTVAVR
ncbi:hypothetical protein SK069_00900 [Patulibacter brassicae]|uniref:CARDB domain-containing protein n=1 Tax=Patulibacter brassicae TaxID=1705717 RepID=A0ABU4VFK4_9ACTN|nr:hypothetical protein [Patulibacter brassicae]MDX8150137.1 hypothetical protein [Patulibacter brassicae]